MITKADIVALARELHGDIDLPLLLAIIEHESSFNPDAFLVDRNGGSWGLMQLDLPTARDRGYKGDGPGLRDPRTNIFYGVKQLDWIAAYLKSRSSFGVGTMIAAYNEGAGAAARGNPDPRYVQAVLAARTRWQIDLGGGPS